MKRLDANQPNFDEALDQLLSFEETQDKQVEQVVRDIIQAVRSQGNEAVLNYTNRFDRRQLTAASELSLSKDAMKKAYETISAEQREALEFAAERVRDYHQHQNPA